MNSKKPLERRQFMARCSLLSATAYGVLSRHAACPADVTTDPNRPNITSGVCSGDVTRNSALIWSRADRPSRMLIDIATNDAFRGSRRVIGPHVLSNADYTAKVRIAGLPSGERIFYRIRFQDLDNLRRLSAPITGQLETAPSDHRDVRFAWSGDTAGQGYGIDTARGGMTLFQMMQAQKPQFFVHSGDVCYSDQPFPREIQLDDGTTWKNLVTEATSKVAETLDEFRSNFRYNLLDDNLRRFHSEVPLFAQWDDHETTNNWYPGEQLLDDDRYSVKSASLLAARAKQAFLEYMPLRTVPDSRARIFRQINYGPLLDLFFLDLRSYRGPNSSNEQITPGRETAFLGQGQMRWLKQNLLASRSTWKVICCDMPLGLIVRDRGGTFENGANGDGPPRGRELEIAELLRFLKANAIKNVIWLTADVHHAASHYYDPNLAQFQDFEPFWEFVSGPLHAGTFGPNELDNTFGPQVRFCSVSDNMKPNRPPSDGLQFFGLIDIDGQSRVMRVAHYNRAGEQLWSVDLDPES